MMEIKEYKGDVLKTGADLICHQVNCLGIMGGGLAKQVREQYPKVYTDYKFLCDLHKKEGKTKELLGYVQFLHMDKDSDIVNIFGQYDIGTDERKTDYEALDKAFNSVHDYIQTVQANGVFKMNRVAIPKYFGCGLAGGDWDTVLGIITKNLNDLDFTLEIVEYGR